MTTQNKKTSIKGFEGYQIDQNGQVYGKKSGTPLKLSEAGGNKENRYLKVHLFKDGKVHQKLVHRLMAETFIRPMNKGEVVDHLNKNTKDNRLENLEIISQSENVRRSPQVKSSRRKCSDLEVAFSICVYENDYAKIGVETIAELLEVSPMAVWRWIKGINKNNMNTWVRQIRIKDIVNTYCSGYEKINSEALQEIKEQTWNYYFSIWNN